MRKGQTMSRKITSAAKTVLLAFMTSAAVGRRRARTRGAGRSFCRRHHVRRPRGGREVVAPAEV